MLSFDTIANGKNANALVFHGLHSDVSGYLCAARKNMLYAAYLCYLSGCVSVCGEIKIFYLLCATCRTPI